MKHLVCDFTRYGETKLFYTVVYQDRLVSEFVKTHRTIIEHEGIKVFFLKQIHPQINWYKDRIYIPTGEVLSADVYLFLRGSDTEKNRLVLSTTIDSDRIEKIVVALNECVRLLNERCIV